MENENTETAKTGNVVSNTKFKSEGDWIKGLMAEHCVIAGVGAVEAVPAVEEVKDEDGNVTTEAVAAVRGKKGKDEINEDAITALAVANGVVVKEGGYPNPGSLRMNVGNMLRAAARKRHGLNVPTSEGLIDGEVEFEFSDAPDDFEVSETKTHNPDGTKIAPVKADTAEEAAE